jgi:hypothetical protein
MVLPLLSITAVYKIPTDGDVVAAGSFHAVIDGNDDGNQMGICRTESERPSITAQEALGVFQLFSQFCDAHDSGY